MVSRLLPIAQIALLLVCPVTCQGSWQCDDVTPAPVAGGGCCAHCASQESAKSSEDRPSDPAPSDDRQQDGPCQCICGGALLAEGAKSAPLIDLAADALLAPPVVSGLLAMLGEPAAESLERPDPLLSGRARCCAYGVWRC